MRTVDRFQTGLVVEQEKGWSAVYADLFRARLTGLVLFTVLVGFCLGSRGPVEMGLLAHAFLGTALVAAGASALNQWWERDYDAAMPRTRGRPLPSGRLRPMAVLGLGCGASTAGLAYLGFGVNPTTAWLGALSLVIYLFAYTPLKRVTWLNTSVGAVCGGMPPLMGWTAACGELNLEGWILFAILFFWQLPHFIAIAWIYRDDYSRAGFRMLSVVDGPRGTRSGRQAVTLTLVLLPVSLGPFLLELTGNAYGLGAVLLGLWFLWSAGLFWREATVPRARQLFRVSIGYLSILLILMLADRAERPEPDTPLGNRADVSRVDLGQFQGGRDSVFFCVRNRFEP